MKNLWLISFLLIFISCVNKVQSNVKITDCIDDYKVTDKFKNWSINSKPQSQWDDVDWLAKVMMSEVSDTNKLESIYLVGVTLMNHTELFNMSVKEASIRPGAFSGVNHPTYHWWKAEPTETHKRLAIRLLKQGVPEHLKNLYAFCVLDWISESTKNWFLTLKVYKKIDNVTFFLNEKV